MKDISKILQVTLDFIKARGNQTNVKDHNRKAMKKE